MKIIDVQIGQVKSRRLDGVLKSTAIGSCIVVTAYNSYRKCAVMTHIMLPGRSPVGKGREDKYKYAEDAIDEVMERLSLMGANFKETYFILAGGGNVLKKVDDRICRDNIHSVMSYMYRFQLTIAASSLGGELRRSVMCDIGRAIVACAEGDGPQRVLWGCPECSAASGTVRAERNSIISYDMPSVEVAVHAKTPLQNIIP